ncbi:hypothetical protein PC121_g23845, partial [Phytophthora cactorum]
MVFRARWTELKKLGSKSKGPTGLSNLHTSIEPSKSKKGVRGQDYFVGEEELMRYLDRLDLGTFVCKRKDRLKVNGPTPSEPASGRPESDEPDSDTQPASGATASTASGAADTQHASDAPEIGANGAAGHSRGVVEPATGASENYNREVSSPETEPAPEPLNDCASLPEAEIFTSEERTN